VSLCYWAFVVVSGVADRYIYSRLFWPRLGVCVGGWAVGMRVRVLCRWGVWCNRHSSRVVLWGVSALAIVCGAYLSRLRALTAVVGGSSLCGGSGVCLQSSDRWVVWAMYFWVSIDGILFL